MKLFGQLIRTVVNVATLPVAVVKEVVLAPITFGDGRPSIIAEHLRKLKDEAGEA